MIIQGTRDSTVLYSDTVALQEKLIRQGKTFELVPIPGSDHKWDDNFNEQTPLRLREADGVPRPAT